MRGKRRETVERGPDNLGTILTKRNQGRDRTTVNVKILRLDTMRGQI